MNKYSLEITYKDIRSVNRNVTPESAELIVELFDGSIIKAYHYEDSQFYMSFKADNEKYEALNKVVNDCLKYANAINSCHHLSGKILKEVEEELDNE